MVEAAIGEQITDTELGGPEGALAAGNAHMVVETEADAFDAIAAFLSYLPSERCRRRARWPRPPRPRPTRPSLASIVPAASRSGL